MTAEAYPLAWPAGWPRTPSGAKRNGVFKEDRRPLTVHRALARVNEQLALLESAQGHDVDRVVVSTNVPVRKDGNPYAGKGAQGRIEDPGVAVYFHLDGAPICMPCDTYTWVEDNLAGVAACLEAIRALERHGSRQMEAAFTGFRALPPVGGSTGRPWWEVIGCRPDDSLEEIGFAFRSRAKILHSDLPENAGRQAEFAELTDAWRQAKDARS